jgi:hypothetical protein
MDSIGDDVLIENDRIYPIREFGVMVPGKYLKRSSVFDTLRFEHGALAMLIRHDNGGMDRVDKSRAYRYFDFPPLPPRYVFFSACEQLQALARQLKLKCWPHHTYYSILIPGGYFVNFSKATTTAYRDYQQYTVEMVGRKIPKSSQRGAPARQAQYPIPPNYWKESHTETIEVWRTRVFHASPEELGTSASTPFSSNTLRLPYLERIWRPKTRRFILNLGGIENLKSDSMMEFYSNASRVLFRERPKGRLLGSGRYATPSDFYDAVKALFSKLMTENNSEPTKKEVAFKMSFSQSRFNQLWRQTERRWKDFSHEILSASNLPQG